MRFHFSKREWGIFFFLLAILAGYAGYEGIYRTFWMGLRDLHGKIAMEERVLSQRQAMLRDLQVRSRSHKALLDAYRQKESDGAARSKMMEDLQEIASRRNVRITDMKPALVRSEESYKEFPVDMVLEGAFVDIMHFLFEAESKDYGFRIGEFRLSYVYSMKSDLRCQLIMSRIFLNAGS